MPEAQVVTDWIVLLSLRACVDRLWVQLMHIVYKSEVVVGVQVIRIEVCAELQMLNSCVVSRCLEVS